MPKIVDHDRRRDELADTALAIIARSGIRAVTTRSVAEESGWSTGVLAHYFTSSKDLLVASLRRAAEIQGRVLQRYRDQTGSPLDALHGILESLLPFDERRLALSRVFLHFYAESTADDKIHDEISEYADNLRRVVRRSIVAAQDQGQVPTDLDIDAVTVDLVAAIDGLSVHALLDPAIMETLRKRPHLPEDLTGYILRPLQGGD